MRAVDTVTKTDYHWCVTASELRRRLIKLGCVVEDGRKHWIVYYRGRRTTVPRHPGKGIKTGTYVAILRQLGIDRT